MAETPDWARPGDDRDPTGYENARYGRPQDGPAQYGPPQYGPPQYGPPQYGQPHYWQQPYGADPYGSRPTASFGPPAAPKPGIIPLRPLSVGEILDGAFATMRRNPAATLGLAAIVTALAQLVQVLLLIAVAQSDWSTGAQVIVLIVSGCVSFVFREVLSGALTFVVGDAVLGKRTGIGEALRRVTPKVPALFGVVLLTALAAIAAAIPGVLLGLLAARFGAPGLAALIGIADAAFIVFILVRLSLAAPALVLEGQRPANALRRSMILVRGSWWRVFGIAVLVSLVSGIIGVLLGVPFSIAGAGLSPASSADGYSLHLIGLALSAIGGVVAGTVSYPILSGALAVLYVDRRMRAEGLDLVLNRRVQEGSSAPAPGAG